MGASASLPKKVEGKVEEEADAKKYVASIFSLPEAFNSMIDSFLGLGLCKLLTSRRTGSLRMR